MVHCSTRSCSCTGVRALLVCTSRTIGLRVAALETARRTRPQLKPQARAADDPIHRLQPGERRMKRVLIIDDSDAIRRQVAQVLRPAGYEVLEAADGVEGLAVIRSAALSLI